MNTLFDLANESKKLENKIIDGNFSMIDLGSLESLKDYVCENKDLSLKNTGKVFLHEILGLTGSEISFNYIPSGSKAPFSHKHKENEEVYMVLRGEGSMEIDGKSVKVQEGSVVKVSPAAIRNIESTENSELIVAIIQTRAGSLEQFTLTDAEIV